MMTPEQVLVAQKNNLNALFGLTEAAFNGVEKMETLNIAATKAALKATNMKDIVDGGYVIIGSPDEVVEQILHVGKSLNVGNLMLLLQFGNMSKDTTLYNTKMFAEKVMPRVKGLFSEWEHKWWPKPMAKSQRAAIPAFRPTTVAAE